MKNILAENMRRFGTKNLNETAIHNIDTLMSEQNNPNATIITTPEEAKKTEQQIDVNLMNVKQKKQALALLQQEADEEAAAKDDAKRQADINALTQRWKFITDTLVTRGKFMPRDVRKQLEKQLEQLNDEIAAFNGQLKQANPADKRHKDEAVKGWLTVISDGIGIASAAIAGIAAWATYKASQEDNQDR